MKYLEGKSLNIVINSSCMQYRSLLEILIHQMNKYIHFLFRNRSQTKSKRGRNNKVAHEAQPSVSLSITGQTHGNMASLCLKR